MSAIVDKKSEGNTRSHRRRSNGNNKEKDSQNNVKEASTVKRERPEAVPVPAEYVGKVKLGVVNRIVQRGPSRFGFINITDGLEIDDSKPLIYFRMNNLKDANTIVRRGYQVSLTVKQDEQNRTFADEITLTEQGKKTAITREAEIAEKRATEGEPKKKEKKETKKVAAPVETTEKRERREYTQVTADQAGQKKVGLIHRVVRRGPAKFGFICVSKGLEIDESAPQLYFKFTNLVDPAVTLRRGYQVSFTIQKDDKDRTFAEGIALTEEGKKIAAAREAEFAAKKE